MRTKSIGSLEVSVVGLGTNNFGSRLDEVGSAQVLHAAIDAGITCIDTADMYGDGRSEEWIGRHLGARRRDVVLVTKFGYPRQDRATGARPAYLKAAIDDSLYRLQVDTIDLYLLHHPDPETPIGDTLAAMNELVRVGKVREIGCSNLSATQLHEAQAAVTDGAARFVCLQNHYNLLNQTDQADVIPTCMAMGVGYMPFYPLASGVLTGKYRRGEQPSAGTRLAAWGNRADSLLNESTMNTIDALRAWAEKRDHTIGELAIAWLASQPALTSVIAGATRSTQVVANVKAGEWLLSEAEVSEVAGLAAP
jgi:aryl-alcohol dehydrogenase-like predicted oxidoreductase